MSSTSKKKGAAKSRRVSGKLKRYYREKDRRQKAVRKRDPSVKEKFVSGCMAVGLVLVVVLIAMATWTCIFAE